jgi:hypothetical protein
LLGLATLITTARIPASVPATGEDPPFSSRAAETTPAYLVVISSP